MFAAAVFAADEPSAEVQAQIAALLAEKSSRTPGQQKMSSSLMVFSGLTLKLRQPLGQGREW